MSTTGWSRLCCRSSARLRPNSGQVKRLSAIETTRRPHAACPARNVAVNCSRRSPPLLKDGCDMSCPNVVSTKPCTSSSLSSLDTAPGSCRQLASTARNRPFSISMRVQSRSVQRSRTASSRPSHLGASGTPDSRCTENTSRAVFMSRVVHAIGTPTPRLRSCATSSTETAQLLRVGSVGPMRSMYLQSLHVQRSPPLSAVISRPT